MLHDTDAVGDVNGTRGGWTERKGGVPPNLRWSAAGGAEGSACLYGRYLGHHPFSLEDGQG